MKEIFHHFRISLPIIVVSALTLLLLAFVGSWEASRQHAAFQVSKLATQGEIITKSVESYLQAGLPIEQYSGFHQLSQTLLESDEGIEHLSIVNPSQDIIFFNWRPSEAHQAAAKAKAAAAKSASDSSTSEPLVDSFTEQHDPSLFQEELALRTYQTSDTKLQQIEYKVEESVDSFKLTLPINSKFGNAGSLIIEASRVSMFQPFEQQYRMVFIALGVLLTIFSIFAVIYEFLSKNPTRKRRILKSVYALSFILMSGVITVVVFQIYEQGAQAKTEALTNSMVTRLNSALEIGIDIDDLSGINETFVDYKNSNPDILEIALIEDGSSKFNTNLDNIGKHHSSPDNAYEYLVELTSRDQQSRELYVSVSLPVDIVHDAVLSSANKFITLMIACGLISLIFIDASTGISNVLVKGRKEKGEQKEKTEQSSESNLQITKTKLGLEMSLSLIKPAYFLIVFVHALSISFLPNMVNGLAGNADSVFATLSLPFTLYYAMFALVLIPAGQYAERGSLKNIMVAGCVMELVGLILIAFTNDYWLMILARAFSGAGQGLFLIGLQSYLLVVTPKEQRTQGAAVKVIGRNAGLISGTAIGALIFSFTDYSTVFIIGSTLSIMGMIYLWMLVPDVDERQSRLLKVEKARNKGQAQTFGKMFHHVVLVFKDAEFVKSLLLVAIPGKIAITGVIMFAIPLLLTGHGFEAEEIGQALMLYYIASIVMTHYASRLVDHLDISRLILFVSTLIGGVSIVVLGFSDVTEWNGGLAFFGGEYIAGLAIAFNHMLDETNIPWISTAVIMVSLVFAGASNGLLTSPVVTHINKTQVAKQYGVKSVTATYTFLERGGHVLGPMLIGYALTLALQSNIALSLFGLIIIVAGLLFMAVSRKM